MLIDTDSVGDDDNSIVTQAYVDDFLKMPEIDGAFQYLIEWINELGFCNSNGMGAVAIPFLEIQAWADLMQLTPTPFDVQTLRDMSKAFIAMQETAKKSDEPNPMNELLES
jgi:hypothetical protein